MVTLTKTKTVYSVRIDRHGASAGVFVGTTDTAGKYHQRAYYASRGEAEAALATVSGYAWHSRGETFAIVERVVTL